MRNSLQRSGQQNEKQRMENSKDIYVYLDRSGKGTVFMGVLHVERVRGKEIFSFSCDKEWISSGNYRALDPDLGQFAGAQYVRDEKPNFGMFLDSSPDRWGRVLMKRREAILAKTEGRRPNTLYESDYLLGVFDGNRMGALRFKLSPDGEYMDNNRELATPPWTSIRDLEYASMKLEQAKDTDDPEYARWLRMLVNPGSSLGGARPKSNVVMQDGSLWIAKFPSVNDQKDMGAWEKVAHTLATLSGVNVAEADARTFSGKAHTFLTRRFDRDAAGGRIHFASAMTLLGKQDGADAADNVSYLDLVEFISRSGASVDADLAELWRRIVFNIAISNCDDHLRNHGFLLTDRGWTLSPAYDMNPDENGTGLKLNISEDDNSLDFGLAMSVAPYFRLSEKQAGKILKEVTDAVSGWEKVAAKCGISRMEQEMVGAAFKY